MRCASSTARVTVSACCVLGIAAAAIGAWTMTTENNGSPGTPIVEQVERAFWRFTDAVKCGYDDAQDYAREVVALVGEQLATLFEAERVASDPDDPVSIAYNAALGLTIRIAREVSR